MNELIEQIFENFTVDGKAIPVVYMYYEGHGEPYITYSEEDMDNSLTADDALQDYVTYYDFNVYAKGNYKRIASAMREILEDNDFVWQVSRTSADMYETDTGYYHKTYNYAHTIGGIIYGKNRA